MYFSKWACFRSQMLLVNFSDWTVQQHFPFGHLIKTFGCFANSLSARIVKDDWRNWHNQYCHHFPCTSSSASVQPLWFPLKILPRLMANFEGEADGLSQVPFGYLVIYLTKFVAVCLFVGLVFTLYLLDSDFLHWTVGGLQLVRWLQGSQLGCACWSCFESDSSLGCESVMLNW